MRADAAAIIVAGGKGLRFGGSVRKQYLRLQGKPLLWWSLRAFQASPSIGWIILVVPADDRLALQKFAKTWKFSKLAAIVSGGATRADSVRQGLAALGSKARYVAVHDAVRPLIQPKTIEATIVAARRHKAAIAACPSKDTVKLADSKLRIASSPARERVWLAQTPQSFERKLLERAHNKGRKLAVTDDSQLVEQIGIRVRLVDSPSDNIKVTFREDLKLAEWVLQQRKK